MILFLPKLKGTHWECLDETLARSTYNIYNIFPKKIPLSRVWKNIEKSPTTSISLIKIHQASQKKLYSYQARISKI